MEEYASQLTKRVVLDVSDQIGFQCVRNSSCDILSELVGNFVKSIGVSSMKYATLSNRTEAFLPDVISSLEDIEYNPTDISDYISTFDNNLNPLQPFDNDIPNFPKRIPSILPTRPITDSILPTLTPVGVAPVVVPPQQDSKIPSFLAPFPSIHTYKFTSILNDRIRDPNVIQNLKTKQKRNVQQSLTKIHGDQLEKEKNEFKPLDLQPITNPYLNVILGHSSDDSLYDTIPNRTMGTTEDGLGESDSILLTEKKRVISGLDVGKKRKADQILSIDYHEEL
jgi:hypothetical protein